MCIVLFLKISVFLQTLPLSRFGQDLTEHVQSQVSDSSLFTEIRLKFVVLQKYDNC